MSRLAALALSLLALTGSPARADSGDPATPFLRTYCLRCHDAQRQEGNFRLDTLSRDFADEAAAQRWAEVLFRVSSGEMPPRKQPQPTPAELGGVSEWIDARVTEGAASRAAKRGPVAHFRLSREEYAFTVEDLLGVAFDPTRPGSLTEDQRWRGYERVGAALALAPSHVERYLRAADEVLDRAFPAQPVTPQRQHRDAAEDRRAWLDARGLKDARARWPLWPGSRLHLVNVSQPGRYRLRVKLSGLPTCDGRLPHLTLWHQQLKRPVYDRDIVTTEEKPDTLEFDLDLSPGGIELVNETPGAFSDVGNHTLNVLNAREGAFLHSRDTSLLNPTGYKLFDDDGRPLHPMLVVDRVEWEGPLTSDADRARRDGVFPKSEELAEARACLTRFASRAWRRPAAEAEVGRYLGVIASERAAGEPFRDAYRAALAGVLASKNFFYLEEGSAAERREALSDWELASRLSYFLWSSMPDDALFEAARAGTLRKPEVLKAQLSRMLADPKATRLAPSFARQWLQLYRVGQFPPDPKLYPEYDNWLQTSMAREPAETLAEALKGDRPLRELLDANWAVVNPRLAAFYGLPAPPATPSGFARIPLTAGSRRGGLLTTAGALSLTSDGTRHRPVHRGVWVSEAVFNRTPPPPPPNVEPLAPTPPDQPKATVRQQIEAHAKHAVCASCHRNIDPLGLAFDHYDAIGRWREREGVPGGKGDDPPVNAAGVLPDGRAYAGPAEFKRLIASDADRFAEAFVGQLATYALRRVPTPADAAAARAVARSCKAGDYRLRGVIEAFVLSDLFRNR